jgi:pterin-4a-carbinolamine dehydratase
MKISNVMRNHLRHLHERYTVYSPAPPPIRPSLPIKPVQKWDDEGNFLKKTFQFEDQKSRYEFVVSLMGHENDVGHHCEFTATEKDVTVVLTTHDLNQVTELDREFAHFCDTLYKSITIKF